MYIRWFFLILRFIKAMQIQSLIDFRISLKEKRNKVWETFSNVIKLNGLKADWAYNIHVHCTFHIKTCNYRCMYLNFHVFLDFGCWMLYLIILLTPLTLYYFDAPVYELSDNLSYTWLFTAGFWNNFICFRNSWQVHSIGMFVQSQS